MKEDLEVGIYVPWNYKALASTLKEVIAEAVHVDQTYCVPGVSLIWHDLKIFGSAGIDTKLTVKCF